MPDTVMTDTAPAFSNRSVEIKDLAMSLVKAQAAMAGAKKDSENPHFKNAYADLASVWDAIRKPLTDNDLAVVQFPRTVGNGVEIETTLLHGKSGQYMRDVLWVPASKNDAQGLGSAITYGRRYALMAVTGIAPVDDDGNAAAATYKPVPGSAGGGGEFRPRRGNDWVEDAKKDGLIPNGDTRSRYQQGRDAAKPAAPAGKKSAAEKAKDWTDNAIGTLNLSAHTVESLSKFLSENNDKVEWLEGNAPDQHERFFTAYNNAAEAARAKVGGA